MIRAAAERALAEGMRTAACLECLAETRRRVDVPLVPMTYSSLLEAYGWERFANDARAAGAESLIVADLPADERPELRRVQLVAPTSTDERIRLAAERTDGWLYLVTLTGTTGARVSLSPALAPLVERARALTDHLSTPASGSRRRSRPPVRPSSATASSSALPHSRLPNAVPERCIRTWHLCGPRSTQPSRSDRTLAVLPRGRRHGHL